MHDRVVRERRLEAARLAGVGANRLDADTEHIALLGKEPRGCGLESLGYGAVLAGVDERGGTAPRLLHPERSNTHAPAGIRPCVRSHAAIAVGRGRVREQVFC